MKKCSLCFFIFAATYARGDFQEKSFSLQKGDVFKIDHQCGDILWEDSQDEKTWIQVEREDHVGDVLFSYKNNILSLETPQYHIEEERFWGKIRDCPKINITIKTPLSPQGKIWIDVGSFKLKQKKVQPIHSLHVEVDVGSIFIQGLIQKASLKVDVGNIEIRYHKDSSFRGKFQTDVGPITVEDEKYCYLGACKYTLNMNKDGESFLGKVDVGSLSLEKY